MVLRRALIAIGAGGTTFLVVSALGFEVFGADFPSVFYVLPIAIAATVLAVAGSFSVLTPSASQPIQSSLSGIAAFGYAFFALWLVRYAIAAARPALPFDRIAVLSAVLAVVIGAVAWSRHPVVHD